MTKRIKVDWNKELTKACWSGDVEKTKRALNNGADANVGNYGAFTSLMAAAYCGYVKIVRLLLETGIDVNAVDNDGESALFHACTAERTECAEILLDAGVDWRAMMKMALLFSDGEIIRTFFEEILDKRQKRRKRAKCVTLFLRVRLGRDVANLIGTMIWIDKK